MAAADLRMGRGHCAEEEQQRHGRAAPREAHPWGVPWWSARLNVIHPYRPTSFAPGVFAVTFSTANPVIGHGPRCRRILGNASPRPRASAEHSVEHTSATSRARSAKWMHTFRR
jgi:hypothetical protein